ncbi:MAG TPA: efflux transporter outer membrane subunit [Gammaproteobacteria bacterium]|jgi:NodT family efflux transporter outer membrane factor (OMF) lipoprotein
MLFKRIQLLTSAGMASLLLVGCAVGPSYETPAAPNVKAYTASPTATTATGAMTVAGSAGGIQTLRYGAPVHAEWWRDFGSEDLARAVQEALDRNPGLKQSQETLTAAEYNYKAANGAFYPQISAGVGGQRSRVSGAGPTPFPPSVYSLYNAQVDVTYSPDIFGLSRLVSRAEQAQVDLAADQLEAARLTLAGDVMDTAFDLAATNEALEATRQSVEDEQQVYALVSQRLQHGAVSELVLDTQQTQLSDIEATLPALEQQRDADLHLLSLLTGRFPIEGVGGDMPTFKDLVLPAALPVTMPTELVRARPDIRAAEAQLRAANAQVGEAMARMYPQFSLSADVGRESDTWGRLFSPANKIWNVAANLFVPIFEGDTLEAEKESAEAQYRGIFDQYQMTVLDSFRQVADVLTALRHDADILAARSGQEQAAHQAFQLARAQYAAGAIAYLDLLNAEVTYQSARIALVHAKQQRFSDTVALYVAMGGGAWRDKAAAPAAGTAAAAATTE